MDDSIIHNENNQGFALVELDVVMSIIGIFYSNFTQTSTWFTVNIQWDLINCFFMSSSMKDFLDKFFDLCREYQEEIPPQKMAEILRDYADRLDG